MYFLNKKNIWKIFRNYKVTSSFFKEKVNRTSSFFSYWNGSRTNSFILQTERGTELVPFFEEHAKHLSDLNDTYDLIWFIDWFDFGRDRIIVVKQIRINKYWTVVLDEVSKRIMVYRNNLLH